MNIKETFLNLTKHTVPYMKEIEYLKDVLPMNILKKDPIGNLYIKIGDSNTMFASHLDTVGGDTEVEHVFNGDKIETKNSVLGADDKAGVTVMLHMIHQGVPGLYVFFLGEEVGCKGSRPLSAWIEKNKTDERYKGINKVVSFDRKDYSSVITFQMGDRCCSDVFADSLIKELNKNDGMSFKKDQGGVLTDSVHFTDLYAECTNLSVGYFNQHTNGETQDIVWLEKFADACIKIDWDNLSIKRKPGEVERKEYSYTNRWDWEENDYGTTSNYYSQHGRSSVSRHGGGFTSTSRGMTGTQKDWRGDEIPSRDAVWCEHEHVWCHKDEAIWVELLGFYTTPDEGTEKKYKLDKNKTNDEYESLTGKVIKRSNDLSIGDRIIHPTFGPGEVKSFDNDGRKITIDFDQKGERVMLLQVAKLKKE